MIPIYFRFEKFNVSETELDSIDCKSIAKEKLGNFLMEDQKGFRFSQVVDSILNDISGQPSSKEIVKFESINNTSDHGYIIPVAVQYHPDDWANGENFKNPSIFEFINPIYLKDLQQGKAILLIDQSVEGYSTSWLWKWFHAKCEQYNIDPKSIIYLTGDQSCMDTYNNWCKSNSIDKKIKVIASTSLSMYINNYYKKNLNINFQQILDYKTKNYNNIFLYDCLNKRPRPQRVLNYLHLLNSELSTQGNISISSPQEWKSHISLTDNYLKQYNLPANITKKITFTNKNAIFSEKVSNEFKYYEYVERILNKIYENSWVSLITESSYFEYETSVFISEKTFKPIACFQPFIIVGSRHSLKYLKKLGYKTFSPFIDESYDDMPDDRRFLGIIESLKKISKIEDKISWYKNMQGILEHNHNLFMKIGKVNSFEHTEVLNYYLNYFSRKIN